jgi:hypothetical protein
MSLRCGQKLAYCSSSTWYIRMENHGGSDSSTIGSCQFYQQSNVVAKREK